MKIVNDELHQELTEAGERELARLGGDTEEDWDDEENANEDD